MDVYQFELLNELAARGDMQAMSELTELHCMQKSSDLSPGQKSMVYDYLLCLTEADDGRAMLQLGVIFYTGIMGHDRDFTEARRWYEKAAKVGDDWALCNLGYCYYYGRDVDVDYEKAHEYFLKSSYQNNPNALYKLGDMYFYGIYVEQDYDAAFYWYNRAKYYAIGIKGQGGYAVSEVHPNICHRLGMCYLNGYGTEIDLLQALGYFQNAERDFYSWILLENPFAQLTLKKTQQQLQMVRRKLNATMLKSEQSGGVVIPLFPKDDDEEN